MLYSPHSKQTITKVREKRDEIVELLEEIKKMLGDLVYHPKTRKVIDESFYMIRMEIKSPEPDANVIIDGFQKLLPIIRGFGPQIVDKIQKIVEYISS